MSRAAQRVIVSGRKLATATLKWLDEIEAALGEVGDAEGQDAGYAAAVERFVDALPDDPDVDNPFDDVGRLDLEDVRESVKSVLEDAAKTVRAFRKQLDEIAAE